MEKRITLEGTEPQDLYLILIDWIDLNQKLFKEFPKTKTKIKETAKQMVSKLGMWLV